MSLDAPPSVFTPPTAAPTTPAVIGPAAAAPATPPITPAPAAAAPVAIGGIFTPPVAAEPAYATLTNQNILWTANVLGGEGNRISITVQESEDSYVLPFVSVASQTIVISYGAYTRMTLTGVSTSGVNGTYAYRATLDPNAQWGDMSLMSGGNVRTWGDYVLDGSNNPISGTVIASAVIGSYHRIEHYTAGVLDYGATSENSSIWPNIAGYTVSDGAGPPTVAAAGTPKSQIITASAAEPAAAALVTATAAGDVSGPIAAQPAQNLSGGGLSPPVVITLSAASPVTPAVIT